MTNPFTIEKTKIICPYCASVADDKHRNPKQRYIKCKVCAETFEFSTKTVTLYTTYKNDK